MNLQLFAEDRDSKTEKATHKKRQEARKKGQVFQSREITSATVLMFAFLSLKAFGNIMYKEISAITVRTLTQNLDMDGYFNIKGVSLLFLEVMKSLAIITGPILVISATAGFLGAYSQVGFLFTAEPIKLTLDRINPFQGFKRLFSPRGAVELLKAVFKIGITGYIAYRYLNGETANIISLMELEPKQTGIYIYNTSINAAVKICFALILFGVADYGYQWWEYEKNLRMTKQEIKEEYKQVEGNPEVKSRIRQKQRQMSMRRMMHEVPEADVVITNPTHYAAAIRYDTDISDAPIVVAKGEGYIALKIKETAREHNVQIVENKELAQTIYKTVDIGEAIPPELYQAVAEILAFVYNVKSS